MFRGLRSKQEYLHKRFTRMKQSRLSEKIINAALMNLPVNEQWLRYGVGEVFNKEFSQMLMEPVVAYKARPKCDVRFEAFIRGYATSHSLELAEVAEKMRVGYNELIKTINGHRELDCALLEAAVLYLGADANDIIAGVQLVPKALREAEQRISDLEALVAALRENNELLKRNASTKAD